MKNYVNVDIVDKGLCNILKTYERRGIIRRLRKVPMTAPSKLEESAQAILDWCQEIKSLDVRANAEAAETLPAFNKGARGVGLFRTEHMFLGDRLAPSNRDDDDRFLPLYLYP